MAYVCDVGDEAQVIETLDRSVDDFGRIDGLFANAGRGSTGTPFLDLSLDEWRAVMEVNLTVQEVTVDGGYTVF